jgi:hypothetical protein
LNTRGILGAGCGELRGLAGVRFPLERVGRETVSCGVVEEFKSSRVQQFKVNPYLLQVAAFFHS